MDVSYDAATDKTTIANNLSVTKTLATTGAISSSGTMNILDGSNYQTIGSSGSLKLQHTGEGHYSIVFYSGTDTGTDFGALYYVTNVATTTTNNYKNLNYFNDGVASNEQGALVLTCQNDSGSTSYRDNLIIRPAGHCIIDTMNYNSGSYPSVDTISSGSSGSHILLGPNAPSDSKMVGINCVPTERLDVNGKIKCTDFRCTGTNPQFDNNLIINGVAKIDKMSLAGSNLYLPQTFYFTTAAVSIISSRSPAINNLITNNMNIYTQCTSSPTLTYSTQTPPQYIPSESTIIWKPVNNAASTYFNLPCEVDGGVPLNYVLYFYVDASSTLTLRAGGDGSYAYSGATGGIRYLTNQYSTFFNLGGYTMVTCRSIKVGGTLNLWFITT